MLKAGLKAQLAFRSRVLADIVRPIIAVIVPVILIVNVSRLSGVETVFNRSLEELALYYAAVALLGAIPTFNIAWDTAGRVEHGTITTDLVKPVDPQVYYFLWDFGTVAIGMVVSFAFVTLLATVTGNLGNLPAFLLHATVATAFWAVENACIGLISAWTYRISYLRSIVNWFLAGILGGVVIPVDVLPGWLQTISRYLPFRYAVYDAANTLIKGLNVDAVVILGVWTVAAVVLQRWLYRKALERMEAFGG